MQVHLSISICLLHQHHSGQLCYHDAMCELGVDVVGEEVVCPFFRPVSCEGGGPVLLGVVCLCEWHARAVPTTVMPSA